LFDFPDTYTYGGCKLDSEQTNPPTYIDDPPLMANRHFQFQFESVHNATKIRHMYPHLPETADVRYNDIWLYDLTHRTKTTIHHLFVIIGTFTDFRPGKFKMGNPTQVDVLFRTKDDSNAQKEMDRLKEVMRCLEFR
jgi:hypothetical protein